MKINFLSNFYYVIINNNVKNYNKYTRSAL